MGEEGSVEQKEELDIEGEQVEGFLEDDHEVEGSEQYEFLHRAKTLTPEDKEVKEGQPIELKRVIHKKPAKKVGSDPLNISTPKEKLGSSGVLQMSVSQRGFFSSKYITYYKPSLLGFDMKTRQLLMANTARGLRRRPIRIPFSNIDRIEVSQDERQHGFFIHLIDPSQVPIVGEDSKITFKTSTREEAQKYVDKLQSNIFLITTVYTVGENGDYPESLLNVKTETAVCFSGGGARSHVCVTGQLRALHHMGLLDKHSINYISATSGGAWAAAIYTYYEKGAENDDDLLGKTTTPENLTMEELSKPTCALAAPAEDVLWQEMKRIFWSTPSDELWETVLGNIYLERFGLNSGIPFGLRELLPTSLRTARMNQTRPHRPFLVLHANMIGPEWADATDVVPIQFTGMYSGVPYMRRVHYKEVSKHKSQRQGLYKIGGGFIDTYAFGAEVGTDSYLESKIISRKGVLADMFNKVTKNLKSLKDDARDLLHKRKETGQLLKHFIRVPAPEKPFSLRHAVGIASDGPALMYKNKRFRDSLNPRGHYFSPAGFTKRDKEKEKELDLVMEFSDGGVTDNLAILPMLQRKVKRIIAFHNSEIPLIDVNLEELESMKYSEIARLWPTTNILPLFGVQFDKETMMSKVTKYFSNLGENQVFHTYRVKDLIRGMIAKREKGEPMILAQTYEVMPNDFWSIDGFWEVQVLWCFLDPCNEFVDRLPEDTQLEIAKQYKGELGGFPNYKTFGQRKEYHIDPSLTVPQINLLLAHTEYCIRRDEDIFKDFINGDLTIELTKDQKARNRQSTTFKEIAENA